MAPTESNLQQLRLSAEIVTRHWQTGQVHLKPHSVISKLPTFAKSEKRHIYLQNFTKLKIANLKPCKTPYFEIVKFRQTHNCKTVQITAQHYNNLICTLFAKHSKTTIFESCESSENHDKQ